MEPYFDICKRNVHKRQPITRSFARMNVHQITCTLHVYSDIGGQKILLFYSKFSSSKYWCIFFNLVPNPRVTHARHRKVGMEFLSSLHICKIEAGIRDCMQGHHVYQLIWTPMVGEELHCERTVRINTRSL